MGRGVSCGGGQSSLGYLFGSGETANGSQTPPQNKGQPAANGSQAPPQNKGQPAANGSQAPPQNKEQPANKVSSQETASATPPIDKNIPAGIHGNPKNNYHRAEGQNCGNFLTDRPSTKVHSAPGGGSSLGYLFGEGGN